MTLIITTLSITTFSNITLKAICTKAHIPIAHSVTIFSITTPCKTLKDLTLTKRLCWVSHLSFFGLTVIMKSVVRIFATAPWFCPNPSAVIGVCFSLFPSFWKILFPAFPPGGKIWILEVEVSRRKCTSENKSVRHDNHPACWRSAWLQKTSRMTALGITLLSMMTLRTLKISMLIVKTQNSSTQNNAA